MEIHLNDNKDNGQVAKVTDANDSSLVNNLHTKVIASSTGKKIRLPKVEYIFEVLFS